MALCIDDEEDLKSMGNLDCRRQGVVSPSNCEGSGEKRPPGPHGKEQVFSHAGFAGGVSRVQWRV